MAVTKSTDLGLIPANGLTIINLAPNFDLLMGQFKENVSALCAGSNNARKIRSAIILVIIFSGPPVNSFHDQ